jgi:hypothetical protein
MGGLPGLLDFDFKKGLDIAIFLKVLLQKDRYVGNG